MQIEVVNFVGQRADLPIAPGDERGLRRHHVGRRERDEREVFLGVGDRSRFVSHGFPTFIG